MRHRYVCGCRIRICTTNKGPNMCCGVRLSRRSYQYCYCFHNSTDKLSLSKLNSANTKAVVKNITIRHRDSLKIALLFYVCLFVSLTSSQSLSDINKNNNNVQSAHHLHTNCNHKYSQKSQSYHSVTKQVTGTRPTLIGRQQYQFNHENNNYEPQLSTATTLAPVSSAGNKLERVSQQRARESLSASAPSYFGGQAEYEQKPCNDCLAIPLVAMIGRRQVSGFLIPPTRKRRTKQYSPLQEIPPDHYVPSAKNKLRNQQQNQNQNQNQRRENKSYEKRQPPALGPLSNEKCPMTGSLTVCDQIDSYPVDTILHKIKAARRMGPHQVRYFNLDSLFSDERDHLSEPFEIVDKKDDLVDEHHDHDHDHDTQIEEQNTTVLARHQVSSINANIDLASSGHKTTNHYYEAEDVIQVRDYNHDQEQLSRNQARVDSILSNNRERRQQQQQQQQRPLLNNVAIGRPLKLSTAVDDFVDIVERRAISIPERDNIGMAAKLRGDRYQTNRYEVGEQSMLILNSTLANRLSMSRPLVSPYPENGFNYESNYQSPLLKNLQSAAATNSTVIAINSQATKSISGWRRRRSRRQVSSMEPNDTGDQQQQQQRGQVDPERIAISAAVGQTQGEPVCKTKSIYISPRAALNDKKEWKYVVNAPERDPKIRQIIRVDICEDPFGQCSDQITLPFGFTSQCKQKYSKKKLLALDSQSGLLEVDTFFIPSCCVCQLVRDRQPLDGPTNETDDSASANTSATEETGG